MLRGVAWGTILFVHMKYLSKLVGLENTTTGALVLAGCTSLFQFIGNSLFGYFFEHLGYLFSYWLIAFLSVFACLGYVLFSIRCGKKRMGRKMLAVEALLRYNYSKGMNISYKVGLKGVFR